MKDILEEDYINPKLCTPNYVLNSHGLSVSSSLKLETKCFYSGHTTVSLDSDLNF